MNTQEEKDVIVLGHSCCKNESHQFRVKSEGRIRCEKCGHLEFITDSEREAEQLENFALFEQLLRKSEKKIPTVQIKNYISDVVARQFILHYTENSVIVKDACPGKWHLFRASDSFCSLCGVLAVMVNMNVKEWYPDYETYADLLLEHYVRFGGTKEELVKDIVHIY